MTARPDARESSKGIIYASRANGGTNSYRVTQFIHLGSVGTLFEPMIDIHISSSDGYWKITFDLTNNDKVTKGIAPSVDFSYIICNGGKDSRDQCQGMMRSTQFSSYNEEWRARMDWTRRMDSVSMDELKNDNIRSFRVWKSSCFTQFPIRCDAVVLAVEIQLEFCNPEKRQLTLGPNMFLSMGCRMYDAMEHTDFVLKVGSTEFKVHKGVLAAGSSVFRAMLQSEMREANLGVAEIVLEEIAAREMIRFMYTAEVSVDAIYNSWQDIVHAADMYDVPGLKGLCGMEVIKMLSRENAITMLVHAEKYSMKPLKSECLKFIVMDLAFIMRSGQWRIFEQSHGALIQEILKTVPRYLSIKDNASDCPSLLLASSDSEDI